MYMWGPDVRRGYVPQAHIEPRRIHLRRFAGFQAVLETVGCCSLVVEVGTGATPCHNGAGYALRSGFGLNNSVIQGQMGPNSLRKA